ncbi:hypothetical protein ABUT75_002195 [Flavobacterium psychrophilum]
MNYQIFNQSGGFPFQTETLHEMQKAYTLFNKFCDLAGNYAIISGCLVTGGAVSNGAVFINGELLEFKGGQLGADVIIVEEITAQEFEDGNDKNVLFVRYATFGIGATSFPWTNFKRPKTTVELTEEKAEQSLIETLITRIEALEAISPASFTVGMIMAFGRPRAEIPLGWAEHTTAQGKTLIGQDPNYDSNTNGDRTNYNLQTLGYRGGKREHQLTTAEMPSHNHNVPNTDSSLIAHQSNGIATGGGGLGFVGIASAGGDLKHTIMSPYEVVHWIKYVG